MRSRSTRSQLLQCAVAATALLQAVVSGQESFMVEDRMVGDTPAFVILERLGVKLEDGLSPQQHEDYLRVFRLIDQNDDQKHSQEEYVKNGSYRTPESRRGIFIVSDKDQDGFVTQAEYVLNRIITDEAKRIVQAMDDDKDGTIQSAEFVKHATAKLGNANLARDVFAALDTNANGVIVVPEYLRVWGRWARAGRISAEKRAAKVLQQTEKESKPREEASHNERQIGFGSPANTIFEALDVNQDREISAEEMKNATAALEKLDTNKDGKLTQDELGSLGPRPGSGPPQRTERQGLGGSSRPSGGFGGPPGRGSGPPSVEEVFRRMDANKDQKLQQDEVPEFARQFIFPADENNDQTVTMQELKKFRENRRLENPPEVRH